MTQGYTRTELQEAIRSSYSIRSALKKLNLVPAGGNYKVFHQQVQKFGLDTSHFTGQACNRGKTFGPKRSLDVYLSNQTFIHSHKLKLRLIREGIFSRRCSRCGRKTWLKKPVPLELEHIDGNSSNNHLDNLCLLCPNCHAQTSTYRGKNIPLRKASLGVTS